jgi:hypothetical protein
MPEPVEPRADAVRPPQATPELIEARAKQQVRLRALELSERRSVARGLILLAAVALAWSMARAGLGRVFVHGWWKQW